jgi:hypothetical protein
VQTHHAKPLGARWEVRVLLEGESLGGQRQQSGRVRYFLSFCPPVAKVAGSPWGGRIASRAGTTFSTLYRQGASKLEFIFLIPHVETERSDQGGFPRGRIAYPRDPARPLPAIAGLYSILFLSAGTFCVLAFFIAAKNCIWPRDFYALKKIYLFDRS